MDLRLVVVLVAYGFLGLVKGVTSQADEDPNTCTTDLNCQSTTDAICAIDTLTCVCADGHFNNSGACVPRKLGDECTLDSDCTDVMNFTFCPKRVRRCRCASGYKRSQGDKCIALEIGDRCRRKRDCHNAIANSFCTRRRDNVTGRVCQCEEDYFTKLSDGRMVCEYNKKIGSECKSMKECQNIGTRIECQEGRCVCQIGYKPSGPNSCVYRELHDPCSKPEDCDHIVFSSCQNVSNTDTSKCLCVIGYREEEDGLACSPRQINDTCESDVDCAMPKSVCNEDKVCACQVGYKPTENGYTCEKQQITEIACDSHSLCRGLFNNTVCEFRSGFCKCSNRYFLAGDRFVCFFRHLEERCRIDEDCNYSVPDSQCITNTCKCKAHFTPLADKMNCRLQIIGGKNCTSSSTCFQLVEHSFCDIINDDGIGRCACQLGYRVAGDFDRCEDVNLLDPCTSDSQCRVTNPNSNCDLNSQVCHCDLGYTLIPERSSDGKAICQRRRVGYLCQEEEDCTSAVVHSQCKPCDKDGQAPECRRACANQTSRGEQVCRSSTCQCQVGYYAVQGGQICQGRKLGEDCMLHEDCSGHVPDAECLRNTCYCRSGFRNTGLTACTKRMLDDGCSLDADCSDAVDHSHCTEPPSTDDVNSRFTKTCACESGYVPHNNGTACRRRQIGERNCRVDKDCSNAVSESYCHGGMCVCLPGFHPSADLYTCTKRRLNRHLCSFHRDCQAAVPDSECVKHLCACKSGYEQRDDACVKRKIGGDFGCYTPQDCSDAIENSTCSYGHCACVAGYHATEEGTSCVLRKIGDETCSYETDCKSAVGNSTCEDGTCVCISGFYASLDKTFCVRRNIGDSCWNSTDCSDVIENSECVNGTCECLWDFDIHRNYTECFPIPTSIGFKCIWSHQCQLIHNDSSCQIVETDVGECICPDDTFVDTMQQECVPNPRQVGDRCDQTIHCLVHLDNSFCDTESLTCKCEYANFADNNDTLCQPWPKQLTDRCLKNIHCRKVLNNAECDDNNTCICQYGYTQTSATICTERPKLPAFESHAKDPPLAECKEKCLNQTNTICKPALGNNLMCQCDYRFAKRYRRKECVATQSYLVNLHLVQIAGVYDFLPLKFKPQYKSAQLPAFQSFSQKVALNGIMDLMTKSDMKRRYVNSKVLKITDLATVSNNTEEGLEVVALLHLSATPKYFHATSPKVIYRNFLYQITQFHGELGTSRLYVEMPYAHAINVSDFDECSHSDDNDCSPDALCINTVGSYMCVCRADRIDVSHSKNKLKGRECREPNAGGGDGDSCSSSSCESRRLFVGLALTLVLVVVLSFITYEIIQHKQSFNAKKLYQKFGTTKIRHLKKASWRRIQESKKKRKKRKKKKKSKTKGADGNKSEEEGDSSLLTPILPATTSLNTEEVPPSPVEIIHTPSMPMEYPLATPEERGVSVHSYDDPEAGLEFIDSPGDPVLY